MKATKAMARLRRLSVQVKAMAEDDPRLPDLERDLVRSAYVVAEEETRRAVANGQRPQSALDAFLKSRRRMEETNAAVDAFHREHPT